MALHDQQKASVPYPPPVTAYPPLGPVYPPPALPVGYEQSPSVEPQPPIGYPTNDAHHQHIPPETKSRGDGFWKGCFAALCCCCVLDMCF